MDTLSLADALLPRALPDTQPENGFCLTLTPHPADHALVSPNAKLMLVGALGEPVTCTFATEAGFHRAPAPAACTDARAMTFSADSRYLLIHAQDGRVQVWDAARRHEEVVHDFGVRNQAATACCLWGTGRVLTGYGNGAVALMPPIAPQEGDSEQLDVIFEHEHAVTCLQANQAHSLLASADQSGRVVVFDRSLDRASARRYHVHHSAVTHGLFSPDGSLLVTADATGRVFVADLTAQDKVFAASHPAADAELASARAPTLVHDVEQAVTSLTCSADGRWLAITYAEVGLTLCDLHKGRKTGHYKIAFLPLAAAPVPCVLFCGQHKYMAVQSAHAMALMFELPHLQLHEAALALAPSGQTVALCMLPGTSTIGAADPTGVWRFGSCAWLFDGGRRILQRELQGQPGPGHTGQNTSTPHNTGSDAGCAP